MFQGLKGHLLFSFKAVFLLGTSSVLRPRNLSTLRSFGKTGCFLFMEAFESLMFSWEPLAASCGNCGYHCKREESFPAFFTSISL